MTCEHLTFINMLPGKIVITAENDVIISFEQIERCKLFTWFPFGNYV